MYLKLGSLLRLERTIRTLYTTARVNSRNYYDVLGLKPWATYADIKMAYYEKSKLYHPDVVSPTEENVKIFREITEAYGVLGSPTSRRDYDEKVLGIMPDTLADDTVGQEDPIESYMRKRKSTQDAWTRTYSETLREKQKSRAKEAEAAFDRHTRAPIPDAMKFGSFILILAVITFAFDPKY